MDLPSLAVILQAALSPNPDERKAAEQSLDQVHLFVIGIPLVCFSYTSSFNFWSQVFFVFIFDSIVYVAALCLASYLYSEFYSIWLIRLLCQRDF